MSCFKNCRVRFCQWQTFAIDVWARTPDDAVELAQTIRNERGIDPFEEIDSDADDWDAEEI